MPADLDKIISVGGRELVDLLNYAVRAMQADLLFVFLVGEYRNAPTSHKAVALYEIFCAPQAPARLSASELLPPVHPQLEVALRSLRANVAAVNAARASGSEAPILILPPKFIFDTIVLHLRKKSPCLRQVKRRYRVERTPSANLQGGKMSEAQRFFVDRVWTPNLRPRLLTVGFRRVSSIG